MTNNNIQSGSLINADYNRLVREHDQKIILIAQKEAKQLKHLLKPATQVIDQATLDRLYKVHVAIAIGKVTPKQCDFNKEHIKQLNQLFPHLPLPV